MEERRVDSAQSGAAGTPGGRPPVTEEALAKAFDSRFPAGFREILKGSRVAIAGLGGLGSNIACMLARSGVGHLFLVDFDRVDITNLNRQAYETGHIGMKKTEALPEILRRINPYLDIRTEDVYVDRQNAAALFGTYPVVCEAFDRPENKAMLTETLLAECPDTVIVAGTGMAGLGDANEIRTIRRMKRLYICGDGKTDIGDGVGLIAPRVAVCAGHQANMVLRLLLGDAIAEAKAEKA